MHLVPFFGDTPISKIVSFDIERYRRHRLAQNIRRFMGGKEPHCKELETKVKPGTINRELATLSHVLSKAVEFGWLNHRAAKINRSAEGAGRLIYLTAEQSRRLIEAAKQDSNKQIFPFVLIALETSMRKMEILNTLRQNVDLARRVIYIPKAKAGKREQPITAHLAGYLAGYMQTLPPGTPWLFPAMAAKSGHTVDIRKPFERTVIAAGLDPKQVVRHTLRHTAISHLVQAGTNVRPS